MGLRGELLEKMELLADYERSMNEGSFTQRDVSFTQGLHIQKELTEVKRVVSQQTKKLKETEDLLTKQGNSYEMELKKCNSLLAENLLIKEQHVDMSF